MKKLALVILLSAICNLQSALSADSVVPQSLDGGKLYRLTSSIEFSTNAIYTQGSSFLFTNMICYSTAEATNATVQGLDGVTVDVAWSTASSTTNATWYRATVQNAASGTWTCALTNMPASSTIYWQCRLTDASTNVYHYQLQMLRANSHL